MEFKFDRTLIELAKCFKKNKKKFYVVGGYVRDCLAGIFSDDIDVCSFCTLAELKKVLEETPYQIQCENELLQTATIVCDKKKYDYSMMRVEQYEKNGSHTPTKIVKAKTISEDSIRRDFTIDAMYVDVLNKKLIDPFSGIVDLKKKILRQVKDDIFEEDSVRILRLFRLSTQLGYKIERKTLMSAISNIDKLSNISGNRKYSELIRILTSFDKNKTKKRLISNLYKFNNYSLWKEFYLPIDKIKFDLIKKADVQNIFLAFVIDVVLTVKPRNIEHFLLEFLGSTGLGLSNKEVNKISYIVYGYIDIIIARVNNKDFFFKYYSYFKLIQPLVKFKSNQLYKKYTFFYDYITNNKIAIQVADLAIKSGDIKKEYPNISPKRYNYILNELLSKVFDGKIKNEKNALIKMVGDYDY